MALRGKKPDEIQSRLKLMLYGSAGSGKTTASLKMPRPYVIDAERGTQHYKKLIEDSGGVVFETTDAQEVIAEVKTLLTEPHEYLTLVIDPITTIYNDALEKAEKRVGSEFGRHFGEANKHMKRLFNLLTAIDMNVVIVAHGKTEYGEGLVKLGQTFDGYKKLDYLMDLVIELSRNKKSKDRMAKVVKTRLEQFPDGDVFDWSYEELMKRYGKDAIERTVQTVAIASAEQVRQLTDLLAVVRLPDGTTDKWLAKAGVETFEDMSAEALQKCIDYVKGKLPAAMNAA